MEQKTRKQVLVEEIAAINDLIEAARKNKNKNINKYQDQLISLILELDSLGKD